MNELERRNESDFAGRLELNEVVAVGHSFGGYTALAIAGATIDFEHLEQECQRNLNVSLLLQCRALSIEAKAYNGTLKYFPSKTALNPVRAIDLHQSYLNR